MVRINFKTLADKYGTPLYVYDTKIFEDNIHQIVQTLKYPHSSIYFAVMCNNHKNILSTIRKNSLGVQINSEYELQLVKNAGFKNNDISFTSSGISNKLMKTLTRDDIQLNLDSVEEVEKFCSLTHHNLFGIRIRIPQRIFTRSFQATNTCNYSHVGIEEKDFKIVQHLASATHNAITGVHGYFASNILDFSPFKRFGSYLCNMASAFSSLEYVNFGSGFGIPYSPGQRTFDRKRVFELYASFVKALSIKYCRPITMKIEPGRILLADAGSLVVQITNIKRLSNKKSELAVNAGFAELARPLVYGSYHTIKNIQRTKGEYLTYDIRGNTVLQNDFLGKNRILHRVHEGDYLLITNVGAYGVAMASGFPGKKYPKQIFL